MSNRRTVLLVGEGVSLAHVTRPLVLAQALDSARYDVHVAWDARYGRLAEVPGITFHPLPSIEPSTFLRALARRSPIYRATDFEAYLADESVLLNELSPDLVVSDYRWTQSTSAELAGVRHAALVNVYWSPYYVPAQTDPPVVGPARNALLRTRSILARRTPGLPVRWRASTETERFNLVRARHGLPPFESWQHLVAHGDDTLYAEPEGLWETAPLPPSHHFIGTVGWSPSARPSWWGSWDDELPLVYITLGSTGAAERLGEIVDELRRLPVTVVVATGGRTDLRGTGERVLVSDYLPGAELAGVASLVICNGGSAAVYQALAAGTPVMGLWSNTDQFRTMAMVEHRGAGIAVRADDLREGAVTRLAEGLLADARSRQAAKQVQALLRSVEARTEFARYVDDVLDGPRQ